VEFNGLARDHIIKVELVTYRWPVGDFNLALNLQTAFLIFTADQLALLGE